MSTRAARARARRTGRGLIGDLYRRGLEGQQLSLIVTDGCPGLAAAIPTVYPRVQRDYDEVKAGAQAIYLAESSTHAESAFRRFRARCLREYGPMVRGLQYDLPELLSVFAFPPHLWQKLRTTNVIERCFVEVRRRNPPHGVLCECRKRGPHCLLHLPRFNLEWKTRTLNLFTQAA
ncbi:MAG TPA: transposase [Terriglobales bacterium]|nr:transposase [Terriglobales bacterium]